MTESTHSEAERALNLTVPADRLACFFPLLQKGFALGVLAGFPLRAFLRDGLGLTAEYIEARIQTIFLDGKPVDDIDTALIRDGATLALAPAMPGLMGAMLRRGGYYAPMRSGITHRGDAAPQGIGQGRIVMKLFGMALRELGPNASRARHRGRRRGSRTDRQGTAGGLPEGLGDSGRARGAGKSVPAGIGCSRAGRRDEGLGGRDKWV